MPSLADYIVLNDSPDSLSVDSPPQSAFYRFNLPSDFVAGTNRAKPVLMFRCQALGDTRVNVHVNPDLPDNSTSSGFPRNADYFSTMSKGFFGLHMEALDGSKFNKGEENLIVIRISGDDGSSFGDVEIGDVVLHFQRSI